MTQILNAPSIIMALGVLQPATTFEVVGFLKTMLPHAGTLPQPDEVLEFFKEREAAGHVLRVARGDGGTSLYALTLAGHRYLNVRQRQVRDKLRFYLLRDARQARRRSSDGEASRLVGASPTLDTSSPIKGSVANKYGHHVPPGRTYWPRISRQFGVSTGLSASSSDTFPEWLSFRDQRQCELATNFGEGQFELDFEGLAACLGVSPKIISQIASSPNRHYRSFEIAKKSGGSRTISSPRVFLKVIQWFLLDFILTSLPVHHAVHSFSFGRSVVTNAQTHEGQAFVGSLDIEDYFGSVTTSAIFELLVGSGFRNHEARLIARLSTKDGGLPQGAPTSAVLSNAVLYPFDEQINKECARAGLTYTRYADDITISGADRRELLRVMALAEGLLAKHNLHVNKEKTRVVSQGSQQRVTGVVVNQTAKPSRYFRRLVRAKFHNAALSEDHNKVKVEQLSGYLSYLQMFPSLKGSKLFETLAHDLSRARQKDPPMLI
ncbi:RNA-directed DNA polymerase [Brevundimonas naejangsanensis]|nr:RNA-directed DNA polymerase [Brevundimonas naejangsanensis]